MRKLPLQILTAMALTVGAILASATGVWASDVMVTNAFARASATPMAKAGAAYLTIMNHGSAEDRLMSVSSSSASRAEIHETRNEDGIMKMAAVEAVAIAPGSMAEFKPGGLHIMLIGLKAPLAEGQTIDLTLVFEKAGAIAVKVPVGAAAAGSHDHGAEGSGG